MGKVDFIEIAEYCVNRYTEAHNSQNDSYENTLYVAITGDNRVLLSSTPHILREAKKCLLIHQTSKLAISNYYSWYKVEYINEEGCNQDGVLGDGFTISINPRSGWADQVMRLDYEEDNIYWGERPWTDTIPKVWELYTRVRKAKSKDEIELIAELYSKDETILEMEKEIEGFKFREHLLKKQRDQYKGLLKEIKDLVEKRR